MTTKIPEDVADLIKRGRKYFPATEPYLFTQPEEWNLYFAMIFCHEEQAECIAKGDHLGALQVAAKYLGTKGQNENARNRK